MGGFQFRKNLAGQSDAYVTLSVVGKNSVTFKKGDAIRINADGFADLADATEGIAGIVDGVTTAKDTRTDPDSGTLDEYTMASDNETVAQLKIKFIPALVNYLFSNDASGDLAQTNLLQYFDLSDKDQVNQGSATNTATAQMRLVELDPDGDGDASKGLFQIVESQFAQIATTVAA